MSKISVVLATYNEGSNLKECLSSVKDIAAEIIIVDGGSSDQTLHIAREFGAQITQTDNPPIFHINKQKALTKAKHAWILQLDADERVTPRLAQEIERVTEMSRSELEEYQRKLPQKKLFMRHQLLIEERDGIIGKQQGPYTAFFMPRLNYFLGKYLRFGGVYPDGVIRLVKKDHAHFPCQNVHEQISIDGRVGWLSNDLLHISDPTFERYLQRNSRYIDLIAAELKDQHVGKNPIQLINYFLLKPVVWFMLTVIRHKGILDGFPGVTFSFFSALRFPRAYFRYLKNK
ncbi:glycosyltransferase family 2 protein [Patescibacteria group bacterium]|nr:glycosyltransferase family 2 protein [Patescibacteria group bacterium]MCL5409290.1 glycosyltransferase family 2 protein [Patescibacteria group bacterium]